MNADSITLVTQLLLIAAALVLLVAVGGRRTAAPAGPPGPGRRFIEVLVVAAWFGLAAAVLQLLVAFIGRYLRHRFLFAGPQMLWMTPLAYLEIFLVLGIGVGVVALAVPRLGARDGALAVFAWLTTLGLLLPFNQFHLLASMVLAIGVAVQVRRIMLRDPAWWLRVMIRSGAAAAGCIALIAAGLHLRHGAAERRAVAALPAARAGAPNVLLLILDTVRATNMSLYGYALPTSPGLLRRAREGTTFDLALATAPWTLKSHATLFSGRYSSEVPGNFARPVSLPAPTLAEAFRGHGYLTAGFVANLLYVSGESGLARGFVHYDDYRSTRRQVLYHSWIGHLPLFRSLVGSRSLADVAWALRHPGFHFEQQAFHGETYERKPAALITSAFLDWQSRATGHPFFAFLNYFDAHQDYQAPREFMEPFAAEPKRAMARYDGAIAYIDHEIARLLDELQRRGVLDNTIVVIASDHGEQFGEHGLTEHANSLYLPLLHVPLFIRYPVAVPAGVRIAAPVTLRDLPATIIELAGIRDAALPGVSLSRTWSGDSTAAGSPLLAEVDRVIRPEPRAPVRFGPMRAVFDQHHVLIRRGDGEEELYAWRTDPGELQDLHADPTEQAVLLRLRALLDAPPGN